MSHPFTIEDLEALAAGLLDPRETDAIESHIETCSECAEEVSWLRAERDAFAARQDDVDDAHLASLWQGVAARIDAGGSTRADAPTPIADAHQATRGRVVWFGAGFGMAAVAAAAMFFVMRPPAAEPTRTDTVATVPITGPAVAASDDNKNKTDARVAIAEAEAAYTRAIRSLEDQYVAKRGDLDPKVAASHDATFARNRALLSEARQTAGDDIEARMLSLDAYARHVRTLQDVVSATE